MLRRFFLVHVVGLKHMSFHPGHPEPPERTRSSAPWRGVGLPLLAGGVDPLGRTHLLRRSAAAQEGGEATSGRSLGRSRRCEVFS